MQTQQFNWQPAHLLIDSNERATIMGGSSEYHARMVDELADITAAIKHRRLHGHELPPQNKPKEYKPCKAVIYGCKNLIDVRQGVRYCSERAHGKGCPQPGRHNNHVWTRYRRFYTLWLREHGVQRKDIAHIYKISDASVSHALEVTRKLYEEPQRKYGH